jgi:hypothetical protein
VQQTVKSQLQGAHSRTYLSMQILQITKWYQQTKILFSKKKALISMRPYFLSPIKTNQKRIALLSVNKKSDKPSQLSQRSRTKTKKKR